MTAETETLPGLQVVQIRYQGSDRAAAGSDPVDAYAASGAYAGLGDTTIVEPGFPEEQRDEEPTVNLGLIGGEIADAVAAGRREGKPVLVVGGNCAAVPGVVGGLQEAHGPAAKIGLVWFDAHGDFNTPRTTLSGMLGGMPVAVSAGLAYPRWREMSRQEAPPPTSPLPHRPPGFPVKIWSRPSAISPIVVISSICTSTPISSTSVTSRTTTRRSRTAPAWSRCWPQSTPSWPLARS